MNHLIKQRCLLFKKKFSQADSSLFHANDSERSLDHRLLWEWTESYRPSAYNRVRTHIHYQAVQRGAESGRGNPTLATFTFHSGFGYSEIGYTYKILFTKERAKIGKDRTQTLPILSLSPLHLWADFSNSAFKTCFVYKNFNRKCKSYYKSLHSYTKCLR